jgi:hypothetical protein
MVALVVVDGLAVVVDDVLVVDEDDVVELVVVVVGRSSPPLHAASPNAETRASVSVHDRVVHVLINAPPRAPTLRRWRVALEVYGLPAFGPPRHPQATISRGAAEGATTPHNDVCN